MIKPVTSPKDKIQSLKSGGGRPLHFAGTVKINAPRTAVWSALTNPEIVAQITPAVVDWTEIDPNHLFELQVRVMATSTNVTLPLRVCWSELVALSHIKICATLIWERMLIETCTTLDLFDSEDGTTIKFEAKTSDLNRAIIPIAHGLFNRTLRQFFINLKAELER